MCPYVPTSLICPQAAKAQGDFLLVGLHTDEDVQARRGPHLPIMNLHERSLSVLSCKCVHLDGMRVRAEEGGGKLVSASRIQTPP